MTLPLFFHPQRGAHLGPLNTGLRAYRGGPGAGWRQEASVRVRVRRTTYGVLPLGPAPGASLPDGFLWGDPAAQNHGMGGPELVFGPMERDCRRCGEPFSFSARRRKHLHETLGLHIDVLVTLCRGCREVRRLRGTYSDQVRRLAEDSSARGYLEAARTAAELLAAGDRVNVDKAIGYSRRAGRDASLAREAAQVEARLLTLRSADIRFLHWR